MSGQKKRIGRKVGSHSLEERKAASERMKKLWTPDRRAMQSRRIREINKRRKGKDSPAAIAARVAGFRVWLETPAGLKHRKETGKRMKALLASAKERKRRSELMKKRHKDGTTGLRAQGGHRRIVVPIVSKPKKKSYMSAEARKKASEHMKRVNRDILTPEKRAAMGRKMSHTVRNRPYVEVERTTPTPGPNKMEAALLEIISPLGFRYVGDGRFWIGPCKSKKCRNPDFLFRSGKNKLAVLFHGKYWHTRKDSDDEEEMEDYQNAGWSVRVIWEKELKDPETLKNSTLRWLALMGYV